MDQGKNIDLEKYLAARLKEAKEQMDNLGSLDYKRRKQKSTDISNAQQIKIDFK